MQYQVEYRLLSVVKLLWLLYEDSFFLITNVVSGLISFTVAHFKFQIYWTSSQWISTDTFIQNIIHSISIAINILDIMLNIFILSSLFEFVLHPIRLSMWIMGGRFEFS